MQIPCSIINLIFMKPLNIKTLKYPIPGCPWKERDKVQGHPESLANVQNIPTGIPNFRRDLTLERGFDRVTLGLKAAHTHTVKRKVK